MTSCRSCFWIFAEGDLDLFPPSDSPSLRPSSMELSWNRRRKRHDFRLPQACECPFKNVIQLVDANWSLIPIGYLTTIGSIQVDKWDSQSHWGQELWTDACARWSHSYASTQNDRHDASHRNDEIPEIFPKRLNRWKWWKSNFLIS